MAHGINAAKNRNREYWARRPFAGCTPSSDLKTLTHRIERRAIHRRDTAARIAEATDG